MTRCNRYLVLLCLALLAALNLTLAPTALAQDAPPKPGEGITAEDPEIAVEELGYLLKPLTKDELAGELAAWQRQLQAKQRDISSAQIAAIGLEGDARVAALAELQPLIEQRTRVYDRVREVIIAYREKGGDPTEFQTYADSVADVVSEIDVTDASAFWTTIQGWVYSKEGGKRWGANIGKFLLILIISWIVARIVAGVLRRVMDSALVQLNEMLERFFVNTARNVVFAIGIVMGLSSLEVEIGPVLAAMGVVGFVLGFALQETLGNFAAGVMILVYQPYDLGDFVKAGGESGSVVGMNLVSTVLKSPDNQRIVVPNGKIWGGTITNVTGNDTRRVDLTFGIAYGDDIDKAKAVLAEVVAAHDKVLEEPAPVIRVHTLGDSSVNFIVRPWTATTDYWDVYWDLTQAVKQRFDAEGISIPFPQQDVYVHHVGPAPAGTASR